MQTTIIKFSQEYRSLETGNRWYGIELTVSPEETELQAFKRAEDIVRQAATGKLVPIEEALQGVLPVAQVERTIGLSVKEILSSPDIKILESYKYLVKGKQEFQEAFDKRLKELS